MDYSEDKAYAGKVGGLADSASAPRTRFASIRAGGNSDGSPGLPSAKKKAPTMYSKHGKQPQPMQRMESNR